jgi:hypothetical protein
MAKTETKTARDITIASINKLTTKDAAVDKIARTVLTRILDREVEMAPVEDAEAFAGQIKDVNVTVQKVQKGKSNRFVLEIGDLEITGNFASRAYRMAASQHRVAAPAKSFDGAKVAAVASLLEL